MSGPARPRRLAHVGLLSALLCTTLIACSGNASDSGATLDERLGAAKRSLDDAASIDITLRTDGLPDGVNGITEATGVVTHDPAFRGRITVAARGLFDGQTVQVVAVDGDVYAQTPFSSAFIRIDPADFNAPDPARLMDRRTGLSTLPAEATGLSAGEQRRDGEQVLTPVSGQVPGEAVAGVFPSVARDRPFDATFWLDPDDHLRRAEVTGPFYGGADVTYRLDVAVSDEPVQIDPP